MSVLYSDHEIQHVLRCSTGVCRECPTNCSIESGSARERDAVYEDVVTATCNDRIDLDWYEHEMPGMYQ